MKIQANQLPSHLKKNLAPCYLVTGDEHLLVDEALDAIRQASRDNGFSSRESHVATTGFDWVQFEGSTSNLSLFAEKRIVELRLPTGKPGRAGGLAIAALVGQLGADLMLVVSAPKLDRKTAASKWAKTIDTRGVTVPVWPVGLRDLPAWVAERMRRAGLEPDRGAAGLIAERVEGNLLAAVQEIEKLRLLLGEGSVSAEDVSNAVADSSRFDVYKLADAALAGDARRAIRILAGLRAEGVEAVFVLWALTRDLRLLAGLADAVTQHVELGAAMRTARVWSSRQGFVRSCVGRHGRGDFYRLLKAAGRADAAAKGQSAADPWQLVTDVVIGLSLGGKRAA